MICLISKANEPLEQPYNLQTDTIFPYILIIYVCIYFFECIGVSVKCLTSLMVAFLIALIRVTYERVRICAFLHAFKVNAPQTRVSYSYTHNAA